MLSKRGRSPAISNGSGRAPNKRSRQDDITRGRSDTHTAELATGKYAELQTATDQMSQNITARRNVCEAGDTSPPSSACASRGSLNSVKNGSSLKTTSLPSLDSDNESMSDHAPSSHNDNSSEYSQSLGQEHAAFPTNFITRAGQIPLNDASLALAALDLPEDSPETMSYGLDRFLNAEDDHWTQYSAGRAKRPDGVIEF